MSCALSCLSVCVCVCAWGISLADDCCFSSLHLFKMYLLCVSFIVIPVCLNSTYQRHVHTTSTESQTNKESKTKKERVLPDCSYCLSQCFSLLSLSVSTCVIDSQRTMSSTSAQIERERERNRETESAAVSSPPFGSVFCFDLTD